MTGTVNQALQRALRRKLHKTVEDFVLLHKCNGVEKSRRQNPGSRFNRLPEVEKKFDLRMIPVEE